MKRKPKRKLIKNWEELAALPPSATHILEIDAEEGCGFIKEKGVDNIPIYLSTHTFYGSTYRYYSKVLQRCGFNINLENWDE